MAAIKGQNLRLLISTDGATAKCVAAAQSCTVHLALQVQEDTTKDNVSDWIENEPTAIMWDAQTQALVIIDGQDTDGAQLASLLQVGMEVLVQFAPTDGTKNRHATETILEGYAIISDLQINAQNQDIATYTIQLTGTGDLAYMPQTIKDFVENNERVSDLTYVGVGNIKYQGCNFACAVGKDSHDALYGWLLTHNGMLTEIKDSTTTVVKCADTDKEYADYWSEIVAFVSGISLDHGGQQYGNFDFTTVTGTGIIGAPYLGTINQ